MSLPVPTCAAGSRASGGTCTCELSGGGSERKLRHICSTLPLTLLVVLSGSSTIAGFKHAIVILFPESDVFETIRFRCVSQYAKLHLEQTLEL